MTQGLVVLALGMATVFAFLVLLVAAMSISAAFFQRFAHRFADNPPTDGPSTGAPDEAVAVAIAAAYTRSRSR